MSRTIVDKFLQRPSHYIRWLLEAVNPNWTINPNLRHSACTIMNDMHKHIGSSMDWAITIAWHFRADNLKVLMLELRDYRWAVHVTDRDGSTWVCEHGNPPIRADKFFASNSVYRQYLPRTLANRGNVCWNDGTHYCGAIL